MLTEELPIHLSGLEIHAHLTNDPFGKVCSSPKLTVSSSMDPNTAGENDASIVVCLTVTSLQKLLSVRAAPKLGRVSKSTNVTGQQLWRPTTSSVDG
jgi:hypothetical protein